jgi:hypothetical protein
LENSLAKFLTIPPTNKNSFDFFEKSWSTIFGGKTQGHFDGTWDARIEWFLQKVVENGSSILELGPLEAAYTWTLEKRDGRITAIEPNIGAFLRCLITKNYLDLKVKFLLGDFEKIDFSKQSYDLIMTSGILYHIKDPVDFLQRSASSVQRMFIWTHYFEPDLSRWHPSLRDLLQEGKWDYKNPIIKKVDNNNYRCVKQLNGDALG